MCVTYIQSYILTDIQTEKVIHKGLPLLKYTKRNSNLSNNIVFFFPDLPVFIGTIPDVFSLLFCGKYPSLLLSSSLNSLDVLLDPLFLKFSLETLFPLRSEVSEVGELIFRINPLPFFSLLLLLLLIPSPLEI